MKVTVKIREFTVEVEDEESIENTIIDTITDGTGIEIDWEIEEDEDEY